MRSIGNRPALAELEARRQINAAGINDAAKATTGMSARMLNAHLRIAEGLLRNDTSLLRNSRVRTWLHRQAQASGRSPAEVDQVIADVLAAPNGEAMVRRYSVALSGDPGAAERGLGLATHYQREHMAELVNGRLRSSDQALRRSGSTFHALPDDEGRMAKAREESGSLRRALETAAVSSGLAADRPQTLQDYQHRASAYALLTANKLEDTERRRATGGRVDLREDIENAFMASKALAAKHDAGLSSDRSLGDVVERADTQSAGVQSVMEDIEGQ
jgi:hypothetical protein